jgi:Ni,Fe-hydrogenase I large subunit
MSRVVVGPFNRVEGDLEVSLEVTNGRVAEAWVSSPLYRGFEQILQGKEPADALVYTPRICGICSVAQSVAAARALAAAQGLAMPRNGALATNLALACENVADHLTHFYLFFMPDFGRAAYAGEPWHARIAERFGAGGAAARGMLPARAAFMHLLGILAGKWPHSLALQPGGVTRAVTAVEKTRLGAILFGFRQYLEEVLFGDLLEAVTALDSAAALDAWRSRGKAASADFARFLEIADALDLAAMGRGGDRFMSYGAYPGPDGDLFAAGVWADGANGRLDADDIAEDVSNSRMGYQDAPAHPFAGVTLPDADAPGYTWCKAPRLAGEVVEVGALARQLIDGHPLAVDLAAAGGSVRSRVVARLLEVARVVIAMESWVASIDCGGVFCDHAAMPDECQGSGLVEAARGSLGHWLRVRNGRILNYQIIAPTTWNFSPRDASGRRGALEAALVGVPVRDGEADPVAVQHVVRSFDPCMVCTVH